MSDVSRATLELLLSGDDLSQAEAFALMVQLTDESLAPARAGALLAALRAKGETPDEIRGFACALRELALKPAISSTIRAVDSVGTGGDGSSSVNLSTGTGLLAAACGLPVVKHGNRSVSSASGSADVLEALGLSLPLDEAAAGACLDATGFTFLFAPYYHPAMKAVAPVRAAMGVRTVFNILGPLVNPGAPPFQLIGAYSAPVARLMADTLSGMPIERGFIVYGEPGWDEATPAGDFLLLDVTAGSVVETTRRPEDYGVPRCSAQDLRGGSAAENADAMRRVLTGEEAGPHRNALAMGAALMLEITGEETDIGQGMERAFAAIDSGRAARLVNAVVSFGA